MGKRKPQLENIKCQPGSPEQQMDMCEKGELRGDEAAHSHLSHGNYHIDMAEEDREGDDLSGDEHSSGLQGGQDEGELPGGGDENEDAA